MCVYIVYVCVQCVFEVHGMVSNKCIKNAYLGLCINSDTENSIGDRRLHMVKHDNSIMLCPSSRRNSAG